MTNLTVIENTKEVVEVIEQREILGKEFKIYGTIEEPLFLAKDVASWIEYNDSKVGQMLKNIDEDEQKTSPIFYSGQVRNMYFLTEDGLYEVLMQSRKPIAKQFKKKVKEILKDIRKHGMYATNDVMNMMLNDPDTAIMLLTNYKEEKVRRLAAEQRVKELQPKASYYDSILNNKSTMTVTQIAKDYGISSQRFNKLLNELGVQYKQSNQWLLYAKYQDFGYTHSVTTEYTTKKGYKGISISTKWTQKGRLFLYELLKDNEILPTIERTA